jgi:ribosomal protein L11 methylase PrmA
VAIDVDEAAVAATRHNAEANGVPVEAALLDAAGGALPAVQVAVANIDFSTVSELVLPERCHTLVTSGYYESHRPGVAGFAHVDRLVKERWAADLFTRE